MPREACWLCVKLTLYFQSHEFPVLGLFLLRYQAHAYARQPHSPSSFMLVYTRGYRGTSRDGRILGESRRGEKRVRRLLKRVCDSASTSPTDDA